MIRASMKILAGLTTDCGVFRSLWAWVQEELIKFTRLGSYFPVDIHCVSASPPAAKLPECLALATWQAPDARPPDGQIRGV